jgi:hypothetical protein
MMGETLEYLEANYTARPSKTGIHSWGHPSPNETVIHFDIDGSFPFCFSKHRNTKWQMIGNWKKVTCKNCLKKETR